ncbi:MAG: PASTA domain-containing protein, partial [Rhodococcus fascians]
PDSVDNGVANGYAENKGRRDYIIGNMLDEQMITQQEHDDAVATPVEPVISQPSAGCTNAGGQGFFCDYVKRTFENNEFFGATQQERLSKLYTAGYDVYTTLDMELQLAAESAINDNVPMSLPDFDIGASVVTVQPGTGNILAMAQNKIFSDIPDVLATGPQYSAVNYNADYEYGASTGFQPGSTYKIFTLLEWLKEGHGVNESMDARKRDWQGTTWRDSCVDGGSFRLTESFNPRNDEGDNGGNFTALFNTQQSKNTGFMAMANKVDLCGIRNTASDSGVYRADKGVVDPIYDDAGNPVLNAEGIQTYSEPRSGELERYPATVLGTNEVAPLQMAGAFATIASGGTFCEPRAIERIVAADGSDIPVPPVTCKQAYSPEVAAAAAFALKSAFEAGTGQTTDDRLTTDAPTLGKTGTTDDAKATWMSGATTKAATVTGVFNVKGEVNQRTYRVNGVQAATIRHRIAPRVMSVANAKWGGDAFPQPTSALLRGRQANVPDVRGLTLEQAQGVIEGAGFGFQDGGPQDSELPAGTVTGTNPSGTTGRGTVIQVYTSNQALAAVPNVVGSTPAQAGTAMAGAGFRSVSAVCQADPAATPEGSVTAQEPAGGTGARPETPVTLTVTRRAC